MTVDVNDRPRPLIRLSNEFCCMTQLFMICRFVSLLLMGKRRVFKIMYREAQNTWYGRNGNLELFRIAG